MTLQEIAYQATLAGILGLLIVAAHEYAGRAWRWWRGNSER